MRKCSKCKIEKEFDAFWWKNKIKGIKQPICKPCTLVIQKLHYKNSVRRREKISAANDNYITRNRIYVLDYLLQHPCIDCNETDLRVLDLDHVDSSLKILPVSIMVLRGWSLDKIKTEIAKCVIRCANCHRKRTSTQFNWRKGHYKQEIGK